MGIVAKQSFFTTLIMYLGAVLGYINLLYLFPKYMSVDEIGIVRTIQDMAVLFVPLAQFGLNHSLVKFYPKYKSARETGEAFFTFLLFLSLLTFLFFLTLFFAFKSQLLGYFEENAHEFLDYVPWVMVITFFLLLYGLLTAYAQTQFKIIATNTIKDVFFRIFIILLLIGYYFNWLEFQGFILGVLLSYGIMVVFLVLYLVRKTPIRLDFNFSFINKKGLKEIGTYALYSLLGTSAMLILGKIDSLMVTSMLGTGLNGIYTTLFFVAIIIEFPKRAITQISFPLVSRAFDQGKLKEVKELYSKSSINQLIAGSLLFVGIWANLDNLFRIMPQGDLFSTGKYVVLIIGLGKLLDMAFGINGAILVLSKYYRLNIILLLLLAVMTVIFNLYFIPRYGIVGAAIGSALALVIFNLGKFIILLYLLKIQPFKVSTLMVAAIAAFSFFMSEYLPLLDNPYLDFLIRSSIIVMVFVVGIWTFKPSTEVSSVIDRIIKIFRKRN